MTENRPETFEQPEPGVRRVLATNPSRMTHWGTNTYIVGEGRVAVIDPGPALPGHLENILSALDPGEEIEAIFVTHSHRDHSELSHPLAAATGATVLAFGDSNAGRSDFMNDLSEKDQIGGGEGVDADFDPHEALSHQQIVDGTDWTITALWTPGHFGNHMCFAWNGVLFTGDHIMGWASSLISPPDGDLAAFMTSAEQIATRSDRIFFPGHGAPVTAPGTRTRWLIDHRKSREDEIMRALKNGPARISRIAEAIYPDLQPPLHLAARRNVFAHLIDLVHKSRVKAVPALTQNAVFCAL
jgi:glyoxylase-like metal-dependent hydrolase (beta-lactamase superfamily II)